MPAAATLENVALEAFFARLDEATAKSEWTHGLHPYPAKFIPHIPRRLIAEFTAPGQRVWDPMAGSGTTIVEAAISQRAAVGTDVNPIATLVARAKTTILDAEDEVELARLVATTAALGEQLLDGRRLARSAMLPADRELPAFPNRDHWFARDTARELAHVLQLTAAMNGAQARLISRCALSAVIVVLSFQESETRWCAKPREVRPGEALLRFARKVMRSLISLRQYARAAPGKVDIITADARAAPLDDESVDLVVTSPPYANSHDYYLYNKLRMFWLGYDVAPVQAAEIGSRNRHSDKKEPIDTYLGAMASVLSEVRRCLRPGGRAVFVVSDAVIRGELFLMDERFRELGEAAGLEVESAYSFDHRRFNAAFQRSFGTTHSKATRVLVYTR